MWKERQWTAIEIVIAIVTVKVVAMIDKEVVEEVIERKRKSNSRLKHEYARSQHVRSPKTCNEKGNGFIRVPLHVQRKIGYL